MLVKLFWRDCENCGNKRGGEPIDAFWVEATIVEAEVAIYPYIQPATVTESRMLAKKYEEVAKHLGNPPRAICFLVARDLSAIDPFVAHYPFHHLWNAYSPFESMPEAVITDLQELQSLRLPEKGSI